MEEQVYQELCQKMIKRGGRFPGHGYSGILRPNQRVVCPRRSYSFQCNS